MGHLRFGCCTTLVRLTTGRGGDAPLRDDRVVVMGLPCRVVAVVDDVCGESKVYVERVMSVVKTNYA